MWCSPCHQLGWTGKGRDFCLEQVTQHPLGAVVSVSEADEGLSGPVLKRNEVLANLRVGDSERGKSCLLLK